MCVCVCVGKWPLEQLVVLSGPGLMDTTVIFSWISWEIQHWPSHQIPLDNPSILPKKPTHTQGQDQRGSGRTHRTGCGCYSSILWNIERGFSPRTKSSFCWNGTLPGPSKRGCFLTTLCSALTFLLQVKCPFACHESMWMEVSGQFHALSALPPGEKRLCYHSVGSWLGLRAGLHTLENNPLLLMPAVQPTAFSLYWLC